MRLIISLFIFAISSLFFSAKAIEVKEKLYDIELKCFDHDTSDEYEITIDYNKSTICEVLFTNIDERLIGSKLDVFESVLLNDLNANLRTIYSKKKIKVSSNRKANFKFVIRSIKSAQAIEEFYMTSSSYSLAQIISFETVFKSKKLKEFFDSKYVHNQGFNIQVGMDLEEIWREIYNKPSN